MKELLAIAGEQHGVVHRRQMALTPSQIKTRAAQGLLVPVHRNVYRVSGAPRTWEQDLAAACLAGGTAAVASHRSAALLWRLRGIERAPVEITVPRTRQPQLGRVVVHRLRELATADVTRRSGIPVTTPARTLLDLGAVASEDTVESALEDAILRGLVSFDHLRRTLERAGAQGRDGTAVLRRLLDERDPDTEPTESVLEDMLVRVLRGAGLPAPLRQHWIRAAGYRPIRIDLAYPEQRVAIEADSRLFHSGRADLQRDSAKRNLLVALGWRPLAFTWDDVLRRSPYIATTVGRELRRAS